MLKHAIEEIFDFFAELVKKEETWVILFIIGFGAVFVFKSFSLEPLLPAFLNFLAATWWLWLFLLLIPPIISTLLFWRQSLYKSQLKYILLELKMPREVDKNPKAMEQILAAIYTFFNPPFNAKMKYWVGAHPDTFALEMVSLGGELRFFVRILANQKNVVEAAFFSYYRDVEITEVEDYTKDLPQNLREVFHNGQDIWGTEVFLDKEGAYPIKTYVDFESGSEASNYDPISLFIEVLSKLQKGETFCLQFLITPKHRKAWQESAKEVIEKLRTPEKTKVKTPQGEMEVTVPHSPNQATILKAVEANITKPAFTTLIRLLYVSPKELMHDSHAKGVMAAFQQYGSPDLNSFLGSLTAQTKFVTTSIKFPQSKRIELKKQRILYNYLNRVVPPLTFMGKAITSYMFNSNFDMKQSDMNIEAVATLFHPPTAGVLTAPHMQKTPSRKAGPPSGLPIFGGEENIEKYLN